MWLVLHQQPQWTNIMNKSNMKKIFVISILGTVTCLLSSCHQKGPEYDKQYDSIIVAFYPYLYESSVSTTCKDMEHYMKQSNKSIVKYINVEDYHHFCSILNKRKHIEFSCESRIYIQMDTIKVCLGGLISCACDNDGVGLDISPEENYWIKSIIGYYNWFKDDDLIYDTGIRQFGIPQNYHYTERAIIDSTEDGRLKFYDPKIIKMILKVSNNQ